MHTRELLKKGQKIEKLALVQAWPEGGNLFDDEPPLRGLKQLRALLRPACRMKRTRLPGRFSRSANSWISPSQLV
jgi:hypothetical protein